MCNFTTYYRLTFIFIICWSIIPFATATPKPESLINQQGGLVKQDAKFFDEVYSDTTTDLSKFTNIYIAGADIEFDRRWERDFRNKLSPTYRNYIHKTYPKLLEEQFKTAFEDAEKFQIVTRIEDADLVVSPKITQLYINGPEFTTRTDVLVNEVGRGKLEVSIDNRQGKTLLKLIDNRETRNAPVIGQLQLANRARNYRDFKFLMKKWSEETVKYLQ